MDNDNTETRSLARTLHLFICRKNHNLVLEGAPTEFDCMWDFEESMECCWSEEEHALWEQRAQFLLDRGLHVEDLRGLCVLLTNHETETMQIISWLIC